MTTLFCLLGLVLAADDPPILQSQATWKQHSAGVNSVTFSHDGRQAASGSDDDTIKLWDVAAGKVVKTFKGHDDSVLCVAFSTDDKQLVSASADNTIKIWDIESAKE